MTAPDGEVAALPVGEVLAGLSVAPLSPGSRPVGLLALVQAEDPDGSTGWAVRVTEGLSDDEVLGVLTGYVEHLRQTAATEWDDTDPTRPSPPSTT